MTIFVQLLALVDVQERLSVLNYFMPRNWNSNFTLLFLLTFDILDKKSVIMPIVVFLDFFFLNIPIVQLTGI